MGDVSSGDIQSEHYHRYLFALSFCTDKDVLDVASGEGYGSACLSQVARSVVGVDADANTIDFANSNYLSDRVSFKRGRAQKLPIEDQSVDVVVSFETLEHFAEHELFGQEIKRVLRPGGLLIISSPNRTVYTEEAKYNNEFHVRELDRAEFVAFLNAHFSNVALFSQRPQVGSVIGNENDVPVGTLEGFILQGSGTFERTEGTPHPPFFVALASDAPLPAARSSVLHNPALLHHVDRLHQQASNELARTAAKVCELERVLSNRSEQVNRLEHILAQRSSQVGELEQILATRAKQVTDLEQALADRSTQTTTLATALADTRSEAAAARRERATASNAEARIFAVRAELEGARQRNEDLISELNAQILCSTQRAVELERIVGSTSWKATWPVRRIAGSLPPGARRQLRRMIRLAWRSATFSLRRERRTALRIETSPKMAEVAITQKPLQLAMPEVEHVPSPPEISLLPSERFRLMNPAWIEPHMRPEFIRLRRISPRGRIAVVLHIYYSDLWSEISHALLNLTEPFDLFVTLVAGASEQLAAEIQTAFPDAYVLTVDNHGRDILPFLELVRTGVLFNYQLVCKLHSKRSDWRDGGDQWRQQLIEGVLGSRATVRRILRAFDADPDLGIAVAHHQLFSGRAFWASNETRLLRLFSRIGLKPSCFEKSFAGGSIFWIRPFLLRSLDFVGLTFDDFECEPIGSDGTTSHAVERLISLICYDAGMSIEQTESLETKPCAPESQSRVHLIANYLPQFHPIPENDAWWGNGFTEWTNVTRAAPQFEGHCQPRLPADLGFYDLRLPEIRQAQVDLARRYGISAFSYYYYWFSGRRLLNRPLDEVLASGAPDFPFMICWANEPWTRNWDGQAKEVLLQQDYPPGWEPNFAADIAPIMRDPRYLRLNGRPLLAIYRIRQIPDAAAAMRRLRGCLADEGLPDVHLIGGWIRIGEDEELPPLAEGMNLDEYFEFPPHSIPARTMHTASVQPASSFAGTIYDYASTVDATIDQLATSAEPSRYRGVMMGWDNTARRGRDAFVFHGATPTNFRRWLAAAIERARAEAVEPETAVFINAWNEWAEGTYLEPDRDFGHGWLEAVASVAGVRDTSNGVALYSVSAAADTAIPSGASGGICSTEPEATETEWMDLDAYFSRVEQNVFIPVPPKERVFIGGSGDSGEFRAIGCAIAKSLIQTTGLKPGHAVLEIGSGIGRVALPLTQWLEPPGRYVGVEIVTQGVAWCNEHITALYANFEFLHADLQNDYYNPGGQGTTIDFRLPVEPGSFDLAVFASVFTHLDATDADAWLRHVALALRPGGRVWGTWFLMDEATIAACREGRSTLGLNYEENGVFWQGPERSPAAVGFAPWKMQEMVERNGFNVEQRDFGNWCERPHAGGGYQDLVVLTRRPYGDL